MRFRAGLAARTPGEGLVVWEGRLNHFSEECRVSESEKAVCCCKPLIWQQDDQPQVPIWLLTVGTGDQVSMHKNACCCVQDDEEHALVNWKHTREGGTVGNSGKFSTGLAQQGFRHGTSKRTRASRRRRRLGPCHSLSRKSALHIVATIQHQYYNPVTSVNHIAQ
jgi:hypothetical protein